MISAVVHLRSYSFDYTVIKFGVFIRFFFIQEHTFDVIIGIFAIGYKT